MIILDKKSYELLFYLLKLEEPETVMAISKKLGQSRRKIYYHLDKINDALPAGMDKIISYPRVGIVLSPEQKASCWDLLEGVDDYSYVLHVKERQQLMLLAIATSQERVTIESLMQLTGVSRNTVLSDLSLVRESLQPPHLSLMLTVSKMDGYRLAGQLLPLIRFLYGLLHEIYTQGSENFIAILWDKLAISRYFPPEVLSYLQEQLSLVEESLGKTINSQEGGLMLKVLPYLFLAYRNVTQSSQDIAGIEADFRLAKKRKEYQIAQDLAAGLKERFDLVWDDVEISLVATLLLSYRKDSDSHLESQDYAQMRADLEQFVRALEETYQLSFSKREDLLRQLLTHCKSLIYRKAYGVLSTNPLTAHIMAKYSDLFYMTQSCIGILEEAWGLSLTEDDLAYVTIHLGGSLRGQRQQEQRRIILVCDEGIGVQKLFLSQCRRYLRQGVIEAVLTSEQFDSVREVLASDLVVSTVPLQDTPVPWLLVTPVLTHEDVVRLIRFVGHGGQEAVQETSLELERLIGQYVKDETEAYVLRTKIEKFLQEELLMAILASQGD